LLALASFFYYKRSPNYLTIFIQSCPMLRQKNGFGYILGDFFHKRIWSPCGAPNLHFSKCVKMYFGAGIQRQPQHLPSTWAAQPQWQPPPPPPPPAFLSLFFPQIRTSTSIQKLGVNIYFLFWKNCHAAVAISNSTEKAVQTFQLQGLCCHRVAMLTSNFMFPKNQGDQIGRTFAYWVLVLHWEVF
jgi:hypothetical protein